MTTEQIITSERAESPMGESKKKATLDDKKAAIEEIAKDWSSFPPSLWPYLSIVSSNALASTSSQDGE